MSPLITKNPESVYRVLLDALFRLISNRINDKAFTDQEDVTTKSYFSTLEGLEAILIPLVNLQKNLFWQPIYSNFPGIVKILEEDIAFVLSYNQKSQSTIPPIEQGTPYFIQGKGVRQAPYWTSECSSFTLSVLSNVISLNENLGLKIGPRTAVIINAIEVNLDWIKLCKRDNGWAWTTDSPSHPWPTWSILDTFEEILNNKTLKDFHRKIESECTEISEIIHQSFKTDVAGSYKNEWNTKVENSTPYDIETALDLVKLMLGISLYSSNRQVKSLAEMLYLWAGKTDFRNLDYTCHLAARKDNIPDGSLVPMTFRTLLAMAGMLKPKHIGKLDEFLDKNHEVIINRVYSQITKSQINHSKYAGLWGVPNGGTKYELYYTERTIEALTEFLMHYGEGLTVKEKLDSTKEKNYKVKKKPKTDINYQVSNIKKTESETKKPEINIILPVLPVLDEVSREVVKKYSDLFQNVSIIFVLHILNDLIPLVNKFIELGGSAKNMYFVSKTYDYPEKKEVLGYLNKYNFNVFEPEKPDHNTYKKVCLKILDLCYEKIKNENKKIFILEDGGYFAPLIHDESNNRFNNYVIGAVEQTTKGYRRDTEIKNYKIPIISVANSRIKTTLEGPEVAQTLQENVIKLIKDFVNKPNHILNVLVIGYGTIGKNLSKYLADKSISTSVYDNDEFKRLDASLNKSLNVLENLDDLSSFDIIIGCSGNTSLNDPKYYWNLKQNVYLISGSSERVEFDLDILDSISENIQSLKIITEYRIKKDKKIINLVCNGEPVNFTLSGGIAKPILDPVYAEMLLSSVEIMTNENLEKQLMDVPKSIELRILEIYKNYYK